MPQSNDVRVMLRSLSPSLTRFIIWFLWNFGRMNSGCFLYKSSRKFLYFDSLKK